MGVKSENSVIRVPDGSIGVLIGAPTEVRVVSAKVDEDGVPTSIVVFPYPSYTNDDGTFVTDDESQKMVVAEYKRRGIKLPVDYEHQTTKGVIAPAAGKITKLVAGGKEGLIAEIAWTKRARQFLADDEYIYHSPVYWYDVKTKRVVGLHSVALTNSPKSHNQKELKEQVAAKALADYYAIASAKKEDAKKGGSSMKELISSLRYTLGLRMTDTFKDLKAALQKIVNAIEDSDEMLATAKQDLGAEVEIKDEMTIAEILGLVEAKQAGSEADAAKPQIVAAPELLTLLGVAADADLATVSAKVVELKHPADMVARSEYEAIQAKLAEFDGAEKERRVNALIEAHRDQITPAQEADVRAIAATNFELAKSMVEKLPKQRPTQADAPAPKQTVVVAKTDDDKATPAVRVNAESALIKAKNEEIMREKNVSYAEANELRKKELAAQA